ncbi:hypothetical protein SLE2022_117230 [Rubroshorea leprosula]
MMATYRPITIGRDSRLGIEVPVLHLKPQESDQDELHLVSFVGCLLANEEEIRNDVVHSILKSAWRPKGGLEVHEKSKNTCIFILADAMETD